MKVTRRGFLFLLLLFGMLLSTADHFGSTNNQQANQNPPDKTRPITFTIETKEKAVTFFAPLAIRVVLHNNSSAAVSLDTSTLRIIPESWHVAGTWGQWMEGEGLRLSSENNQAERIELPGGATVTLLAVEEWPTFESLGPVRVAYKLSSTDAATRNLLSATYAEAKFDVPPTGLISSVWAARTEADRPSCC